VRSGSKKTSKFGEPAYKFLLEGQSPPKPN